LPVEIANRLEKLERDFLWGGLGDEFEYQHVNWKTMFASIQDGGRRLLILNLVLLGKWQWPYLEEKDHLWRKLVVKKYGISWGQRHMNEVWGPCGVCLLKYTRRGLMRGLGLIVEFAFGINYGVGETMLKVTFF
jgi:hypothetical protein